MRKFQLSYLMITLLIVGCKSENSENDTNTKTENSDLIVSDSLITEIEFVDSTENTANNWFVFEEDKFHVGFNLRVYLNDPDVGGVTNIRDKPNGKIIEKLPHDDEYMFYITDQKDGWYQFNDLVSFNEMEYVTDGWIHQSVVGLSNRMCDNNQCLMYKFPMAEDSLFIMNLPMEISLKPKRLYGEFVEVTYINDKGKSITGWIHTDCTCGNPVTTCP